MNHNEQVLLFSKVFDLKKQGLGYKRIINKVKLEDNVRLALGTLSYWFNNDVKMIGGENYFEAKPSPELSYILGVMFGDGSAICDKSNQDYYLRLQVKDKDFAEKFSEYGAKILGKEKPFAVIKAIPKHFSPLYSTQVRSKQLYNFVKEIKQDFEKAKPFIEEFPAEFVRGLADSEGTACVSPSDRLHLAIYVASSANNALLEYMQDLLFRRFHIETTLKKVNFVGQQDSIINGRIITRTKDVYRLTVSKNVGRENFSKMIGFSIWRKQVRIIDYEHLEKNFEKSIA
ncbi:MAG: hypothetical protein HY392_02225, partial [Candidatus Diapherotrites archaeon]|nr:hypothetical protein [Candidatus Diapherotrites archaeon]